MFRSRSGRTAAWALLILFVLTSGAHAKKPEDVFGGSILTSGKRFPTSAKSEGEFVSKLKSQKTDRFDENEETKSWTVHYAAFFKRPVDSMEVTLVMYDITGGGQRMVESYQQYLDERGQRAITGKVELKRGDGSMNYNPNSEIMMVMQDSQKRIVAKTKFRIYGKVKKHKGKVVFGEDET